MGLNLKRNEKRRADLVRLSGYVAGIADGAKLYWERIAHDSGVPMDNRGKGLFRLACKTECRPYKAMPGDGVEMSFKDNALDIARSKVSRVHRAARIASTTTSRVSERHSAQMSEPDNKRLSNIQGVMDAIVHARRLARAI